MTELPPRPPQGIFVRRGLCNPTPDLTMEEGERIYRRRTIEVGIERALQELDGRVIQPTEAQPYRPSHVSLAATVVAVLESVEDGVRSFGAAKALLMQQRKMWNVKLGELHALLDLLDRGLALEPALRRARAILADYAAHQSR